MHTLQRTEIFLLNKCDVTNNKIKIFNKINLILNFIFKISLFLRLCYVENYNMNFAITFFVKLEFMRKLKKNFIRFFLTKFLIRETISKFLKVSKFFTVGVLVQ
jgi:hypothetical protein